MESVSDTTWDVVIHGTDLQQSLVALALSRSGRKILHLDPNEYYGGTNAALSLQEVETWAAAHSSGDGKSPARNASITKTDEGGRLSFSRAYSLALSPQFIHTRSALVSHLVSSRAFRQIEFLSVGSFFILDGLAGEAPDPALSRIPSTREDVFASTAIPAKSKRSLMKFLKFVLDYDAEPQRVIWGAHADETLQAFLAAHFKLDPALQSYIITLTLSRDGKITVEEGLSTIHRHLTSMGVFGPGFAAIYPQWGGLSEVAQVGCRACAVGGGLYMLGTEIRHLQRLPDEDEGGGQLELQLSNDITIKCRLLIRGSDHILDADSVSLSKLVAIVDSHLPSLFEQTMEGAPTPAVAVVAIPVANLEDSLPVYAVVHSSDTGECPAGQSIIYLTTVTSPTSKKVLEDALSALLGAVHLSTPPQCLFRLAYEECAPAKHGSISRDGPILTLPSPSLSIAFEDEVLAPVRAAWDAVMAGSDLATAGEYMTFEDREGANDDDDMEE